MNQEGNNEKRFYVLRAISGKEKKVKEAIEYEMSLSESSLISQYVYRVVVPTEKVMTQRKTKKVIIERPYLPGYVLIECQMSKQLVNALRDLPDVLGFLGNDKPGALSPSEVEKLLHEVDSTNEGPDVVDVQFVIGESVKIIDGAFVGFSATIEEILSDKKKLKVMVKIFGRKTPLELGYAQVEKE